MRIYFSSLYAFLKFPASLGPISFESQIQTQFSNRHFNINVVVVVVVVVAIDDDLSNQIRIQEIKID